MNNNQPLVSVGIPTFNRPESLKRALECISRQSYKNIEIIVSDNASPGNGTKNVVGYFMLKDPRISYIRQSSNLGPVENFQHVLDVARGEYFMWMADDDYRAPEYIESFLSAIRDDDEAALAFCDVQVLGESGERRDDYFKTYSRYLKKFSSGVRLIRLARFFMQNEIYGKACLIYGLYRRRIISQISLPIMLEKYGFYGLDNLVVFQLLRGGKALVVDKALYWATTGNVKNYATRSNGIGWQARFSNFYSQLKYLISYAKLSSGWEKVVIILLLPIKILNFYLHIIMVKCRK